MTSKDYDLDLIGESEIDNIHNIFQEAFELIDENMVLESTSRIIHITLEKHMFSVRWDTKKNLFWVIDSNEGFLCFEDSQIEPKKSKELLVEYLNEKCKLFYPGTKIVRFVQLKKDI